MFTYLCFQCWLGGPIVGAKLEGTLKPRHLSTASSPVEEYGSIIGSMKMSCQH